MTRSPKLRREAPPACAWTAFHLAALAALAAALALIVLLAPWSQDTDVRRGDFLRSALGKPAPAAPLVRRPAPGVTVSLRREGLTVDRGDRSVGLTSLGGSRAPWRRFAGGVSRRAPFGAETITVGRGHAEQYLTVERRTGRRTWRWELETLDLRARVGHDGAVAFLDGPRLTDLTIPPPAILDRAGNDVTPDGTAWALERVGRRTLLTLSLDDADLPLPYVIDPAITYDATTEGAAAGANSNSASVARPAGVRENDVIVVHLAHRLGTGGSVTSLPSGWTALTTDDNNTTIEQDTYWRKVGPLGSEPASYAWGLSANTQWVIAAAAFSGIDGAAPSDVNGGFGNATSATVNAPAIGGGVDAGSVVLGHFALGNGVAGTVDWTTAGGWTEIFDHQSGAATVGNRVSSATYYTIQPAAGGTAAQSATCGGCGSARNVGVQTALKYDPTAPTAVTVTAPATGRGTIALSGTATEAGSSLDVQFQRSPAGAGTWTNIGAVLTAPPYTASFDTTAVADGFYDVRVLATNGAGDSTASTAATVRVDNSSPDQNPLTLTELTGTALQSWDATNRVHYYNPTGAGGTFSLSSAPRDVQPAITYIGSSGGANNNSPLTLNVPAGVQAGDLLIAQVGYERTMAISVPTPAGWTRHVDRDNGTIYGQVIFYRWATATEPASYIIPHASGAASIAGTLLAYRGVASVSPVMVNNGTVATGSTLTAPSVTTPAGCGRLVAFYGLWNTATLSTPTGMTQRATAINTEAGWNSRVLAVDEILGAAGATGTRISTATVTATNTTGPGSNVSELVALRPNVCVASVDYPAPGQAGFTGGGNLDTVEPYAASPDYTFTNANATEPGAKSVIVADEAGNPVLTTSITFRRDVTPPSFAAPPAVTSGFTNSTTIPVTPATATDTGGAGVDGATYVLERESGTLFAGSCTWTGIWTTVTLVAGNDTGVSANCYRYRNKVTDNVSNEGTSPVSGAVMVDTGAPSPGTVSVSESDGGSHASGSTLYYRPAGAGGSFDVTVTSPSDGLSGIAKIAFPGLAGGFSPAATLDDTAAPYTRTYSWTTGATASGPQTVTAHDGADNTATATFTLTPDSTAPAGQSVAPASVPPSGFYATATVDLTPTDGSDGGSGLDLGSRVFERESGVLSAGSCSSWTATWTTVSDPDTVPASGCYRYRLRISDNVGNQSAPSAASAAVLVDLTDPAPGTVTVTESNADTHASGSTLFYRPAGAGGSFTVTSTATDGHSGVEKVSFPGLAGGFAPGTSADDTASPYDRGYTVASGASETGAKTLTVTDLAGRTGTGSFTLAADATAPTTTDDTGAIGGGWKTTNQTVTLSPSDGGSGSATTYYTADGSLPTLASPQGTSVALTTDGLHVVRYFSVDNVGNQEAAVTAGTTIRIDKTDPSTATLDPLPARIRNGQVLTGAGDDSPSGVASLTYLYCAGAACTPGTPIGSSSTAAGGYPVTWNAQPADGTYTVAVRVTDAAGRTLDSSTRTVVVDNTAPTAASGTVNGSTLQLTLSEPLDGGVPAATAFVVKENGIAQGTPTNVSIAGSVVTLTLAGAVVHSDAVTVAYTMPGSGTVLRDVAGNAAASFGDFAVTNSTPNVLPTATVALSPAVVRTNDTATATATKNDTDGDPVTLTYVWKVNGAVVKTTSGSAALTDTLDLSQAGNGGRGDTLSVEVTPNDGLGDGSTVSDSKVVANSAPAATVALSSAAPGTDDTLTATATRADADGDAVTLTYVWKVNGVVRQTTAGTTSLTDTFDLSVAGNGTSGDTILVEVTPDDGTASGSTVTDSATVASGVFTPGAAVGISGTARVGETLTRVAAGWTPAPDSRAYQWRRCDAAGGSCADIAGATGTSYALVPADLGATIRVVETASRADYTDASSTSAQTAVVAPGTITSTAAPTVSGTPTTGFTLTANAGSWTPAGTSSAFQWVRCNADGTGCADLSGETGTTYVPVAADLGKKLKVRETASKAGYADASADSALTAVITDADTTPPTNTIALGSPAGAFLSGTTLYYRPAAGGSFTLSSTVADSGAGPASAAYPALGRPGWTHGAETVNTPAGGPYVSSTFTFTPAASGTFAYVVTAADAWSPPNTSDTTLSVTEDSTAPVTGAACNAAACSAGWYTSSPVSVTLSATDGGAGVDLVRYTTDGTDPTLFNGSTYLGPISVSAGGTTTVKFRAFDRVGNTEGVQTQLVRVDTVAPETTIDGGPSGATTSTNATFTFSSSDGAATFECRLLPGGSWGACASPQTYSSLADGTYTFEVRANDPAGNPDASPAARTWTIDTAAADTTITGAPPADTNFTGATFTFTASDAGPTFECRLDAGGFAPCGSPRSYAGLAEGTHTFAVRAVDAAGNADPTPASHTWTVDTTAPETTIPLTPADPSANTTPTFGFASSQSPATYACRLDGGGWAPCATPYTVSPALGDGPHTLEVRASDAAGNTDASPASYGWVVDATAPTGALTAPADGSAVSGTAAVASSSADAGGSGVMHALFERSPAGAGSWTAIGAPDTTSPYSVGLDTTALADGDYDLRVTTRDNAGNATVSALRTVTVDNAAPNLTASAPDPVNLGTPDPAAITATASDAGTGVSSVAFEQCNETSVACDSDSWTTLGVDTTSPYSAAWPLPTDGMRLLRVRATDGAGRQRTELILTTVDRTAPSGTLTAPAAGANLRGSAPVSAAASDPAPGGIDSVDFQITGQGAPYSGPAFATDASGPSYDGTLDTTPLADGLYDVRAFVNGVNGNSSASPRVTVRIDNTNPTGAVTAPVAGANLRGTVTLTSDSADPAVGGSASGVASVQFQRSPAGAGTWTNQATAWDTTGVGDGLYDLRVITTDNAGGSFTSPVVTVRVDNTDPTGAVTAPVAGANLRGTVTLTSDSADPAVGGSASGVASVQFQRSPAGAGTWTNQPAAWNTTGVGDGLYDLRVITTDNAGGSFTSPVVTVRIDNTAPTGSITAPANGAEIGVPPVALTSDSADPAVGGSASGVDTVVFERRPAGGGAWTATPASWNTASGPDAVADGSYELRVTTTDRAGNAFSSPAVTVLVDHTAPVTTASLSPGSPSNAPVTVSLTAGDGTGSGVGQTAYRVDGGSTVLGTSVVVAAPGDGSNDGPHVVEFFSTDEVGNVEATKSVTVVIDTTAPAGSAGDPGAYLRGIAVLAYTTSATDVASVQFQFSPAGANAWAAIGPADVTPPYEASWNTTLVADAAYDLRAVVTDSVGNVAQTALPGLPKYVDNTAPTGSVTAPPAAAFVSGSVDVTATGGDGAAPPASGVSAVRFEVKPSGSGSFAAFGTETVPVAGSTYRRSLDTTAHPDGPAELRVVVTDVAGNETTSATRTITIDNLAPTVSLADPGAAISGTPTLTATAAADTVSVTFEQRPAGGGAWTAIATDSVPGDGFAVSFATTPLTDGVYELRARALDGGGNTGASAVRSTRIDNEQPTGSITAPAVNDVVGGSAVAIAASAADTGSGVASVEFTVQPQGAGTYATISTDVSAPFGAVWDATGAPDGTALLRVTITDLAGNQRQSAVVPVTVDSTGPTVTLGDPGAVVSGAATLAASTAGGATRVVFGVSPAGGGSWTQLAEDTASPFSATVDTAALADGLYDLRAIGYDAVGNASAPAVRSGVRFDNTAPRLVSSTPEDGSVSAAVNEIVLTASEAVTVTGIVLDGGGAPAPTISGSTVTFSTGTLAEGLHVLSGRLRDAGGSSTPFRVAVTVESTPAADRPPVEKSGSAAQQTVVTAAGALARATVAPGAWPARPSGEDFLVIRVDPAPPAPAVAPRLAPGTQVIEVTARWALAGTSVTQFEEPLAITIPNAAGRPVVPAVSSDGSSWRPLALLGGASLPEGRQDGFYRDGDGVHVLTRHLTYFALLGDVEPPTPPRHTAGVVDADGLTLRWVPGTDDSGELGHVLLYVNGESYGMFDPTEFEAKLGPFTPDDTRTFTFVQLDAAGNRSVHSPPLRGVPAVAGLGLEQARKLLAARGFSAGEVTYEPASSAVPGTVLGYEGNALEVEGTRIPLRIAGTAPQTQLSLRLAIAKRLVLDGPTAVGARVSLTRPARLTATLLSPRGRALRTWRYSVRAGTTIVKLRIPRSARPGLHRLVWVARADTSTIRRSLALNLMAPFYVRPAVQRLQVVVAAPRSLRGALPPHVRVLARTDVEEAYELSTSRRLDVRVVVVDVDAFGLRFVRELRQVFPYMRLVAVASDGSTLARAKAAGASVTLRRSRLSKGLAYAVLGR